MRLEGVDGAKEIKLLGGLLGVVQDAEGFVEPHVGWAVAFLRLGALLDRVLKEHEPAPPMPATRGDRAWRHSLDGVPAEAFAIAERCDGAVLFGGRARWLALADQRQLLAEDVPIPGGGTIRTRRSLPDLPRHLQLVDWRRCVDFEGGAGLAYGLVRTAALARGLPAHEAWVVAVGPDDAIRPGTPIVAKSLQAALRLILEHEGRPWFDAPDYVPDARLGDAGRS